MLPGIFFACERQNSKRIYLVMENRGNAIKAALLFLCHPCKISVSPVLKTSKDQNASQSVPEQILTMKISA